MIGDHLGSRIGERYRTDHYKLAPPVYHMYRVGGLSDPSLAVRVSDDLGRRRCRSAPRDSSELPVRVIESVVVVYRDLQAGVQNGECAMKYRWPAPEPCNANLGMRRRGKPQDLFVCLHFFRKIAAAAAASFAHGLDDLGDVLGVSRNA